MLTEFPNAVYFSHFHTIGACMWWLIDSGLHILLVYIMQNFSFIALYVCALKFGLYRTRFPVGEVKHFLCIFKELINMCTMKSFCSYNTLLVDDKIWS